MLADEDTFASVVPPEALLPSDGSQNLLPGFIGKRQRALGMANCPGPYGLTVLKLKKPRLFPPYSLPSEASRR